MPKETLEEAGWFSTPIEYSTGQVQQEVEPSQPDWAQAYHPRMSYTTIIWL